MAVGATLLGCEKAQEPAAHLPPRPMTAARVEVPAPESSTPVVGLPISTAQECGERTSISDATGKRPGTIQRLFRVVLSPSIAFGQGRTKIAKSNSDVHLQMLNGHRYDFQAVGEFIALKSESGSLEIQVRHQPYANSKWVSVSTAVAMNVAGDQVAVYSGQPVPLRVNHQPVVLKEPVLNLRKGGEIQRQGNGFVVIWPSKTQARVLFGSYLDYVVTVCPSEQGRMAGLLGDPNADPEKGLTTQNGTAVQLAGLSRAEAYKQLHRTFGDSWRISQRESLFGYDKGQSTQTFTDLNFPYEFDPAMRLTDAQRQDAKAVCRKAGISDPAALADCILDVGITGDRAFADNNALVERMYGGRGCTLVGIHSVGVSPAEFGDMGSRGAKMVWSPLSNLLLYGETADVAVAKAAGVLIRLAPDWSPSGSKSALGEFKVADLWNRTWLNGLFSNRELVEMVTRNPAQALGWGAVTGQVTPGFLGDVLVVDRVDADPYRNLILATEANVQLVVIRGEPLYGDESLMRRVKRHRESVNGASKLVRHYEELSERGAPSKITGPGETR